MRHLFILFAGATLLFSCQSNDGPISQEVVPAPIEQGPKSENPIRSYSVADVAAKGGVQGKMNSANEMQGAKPGEVRGFLDDDGTKSFVLKTDGKTTPRQFADYVFNKQEKMNIDPDELLQKALELMKHNGIEADPDKPMGVNQEIVCRLKLFASFVKPKKGTIPALKDSPISATKTGGSKKALGYTTPTTGGLDID
jgi:hypothetical protein